MKHRPKSLGVNELNIDEKCEVLIHPLLDDQQRINTFSKLNSRVRNLDEKLGELKVRRLVRAD